MKLSQSRNEIILQSFGLLTWIMSSISSEIKSSEPKLDCFHRCEAKRMTTQLTISKKHFDRLYCRLTPKAFVNRAENWILILFDRVYTFFVICCDQKSLKTWFQCNTLSLTSLMAREEPLSNRNELLWNWNSIYFNAILISIWRKSHWKPSLPIRTGIRRDSAVF